MLVFEETRKVIPGLMRFLNEEGTIYVTKKVNSRDLEGSLLCVEANGISIKILNFDDRHEMLMQNGLNPVFAEHDFLDRILRNDEGEYISDNPGNAVKFDNNKVLKPYLDKYGRLDYTYSERLCYQYKELMNKIVKDPMTRQAFMSVYDPYIDGEPGRRVPCSIGYQLIYREDKLNMIYYMRSLNVLLNMGYDIYTSSRLLEHISDVLGYDPGYITFCVGSLHYFKES